MFPCKLALIIASTVALAAVPGCSSKGGGSNSIKVAAAADLAFAFEELGKVFEAKTKTKVTFTFGSTGNLAKQIAEGAPYDVFAAANVSFVDDVVAAKACDGSTKALYGRGRIVVWTKKSGSVAPPTTLADLTDARFVKIAIANPEHAPYGRAAKEALESAGVWDAIQPKLVFGENVQQTLKFAQTGNTEASIAALSLATVTEDSAYFVIDAKLHKPINQALVVCTRGSNAKAGQQFATFVGSPEGREIMKRFGFRLPDEADQ